MGEDLFAQFIQIPDLPVRFYTAIMSTEDLSWFDDVTTINVIETQNDIMLKSLNEALDSLVIKMGDMGFWRWGKLHTVSFFHPLFDHKRIGALFNLGPFEVGGSDETINNFCCFLNTGNTRLAGAGTRCAA